MEIGSALEIVQQALTNPVSSWQDYTPQNTPIVIFDDAEFAFVNHPNPPSQRPNNLTAATAVEIEGVLTATIPLTMCEDEQTLVPLLYHECFHVYQGKKFQFTAEYNFFKVLAFYPELNHTYRALCWVETNVVNDKTTSPTEKAKLLAFLNHQRHAILSKTSGLLEFEKDLERREGTASFVEQKGRAKLFNVQPDGLNCRYGYSRQYFMGAMLCWLFEQIYANDEWQEWVEAGKALSELLLELAPQEQLSSMLIEIECREEQERQIADKFIAEANEKIEDLFSQEALTIKLPETAQIFRSFSPQSVVSLGDGRLIHTEFVTLQMPNGQIAIQGELVLENYNDNTVTFSAVPFKTVGNYLNIHTESIQVTLESVRELPNGIIEAG